MFIPASPPLACFDNSALIWLYSDSQSDFSGICNLSSLHGRERLFLPDLIFFKMMIRSITLLRNYDEATRARASWARGRAITTEDLMSLRFFNKWRTQGIVKSSIFIADIIHYPLVHLFQIQQFNSTLAWTQHLHTPQSQKGVTDWPTDKARHWSEIFLKQSEMAWKNWLDYFFDTMANGFCFVPALRHGLFFVLAPTIRLEVNNVHLSGAMGW